MSSDLLVTLPVVIPILGALAGLMAWRSVRVQRWASIIASTLLLASAVELLRQTAGGEIIAVRMGGWPSPVAITFLADITSAIMVLLNAIIGFAGMIYALGGLDHARERSGYHPLMLALLASVSGAFLTADLFNLYVWFEVMLMSSFVLLAIGGKRPQLEGAIKYVTLNLIGSILFLAGVGLTYSMLGTLNMAHLAERLAEAEHPERFTPVAGVLLVAFCVKAAAFPFFSWLPATYHTPAPVISAVFAGMLTKVGVYVIIRVFSLLMPATNPDSAVFHEIILWIAGLTMVTGVVSAAAQSHIRRILSFHIISQIGYMLMGMGLAGWAMAQAASADDAATALALRGAGALAMGGAVFYILHHIIVKANLFLVAGMIERLCGSGELASVGGLTRSRPLLGALFMIPALSLAGIPILSGFWAKYVLVVAGLKAGAYAIVIVALAVGLMTLYSMMKIWSGAFWTPPPDPGSPDAIPPERIAHDENEAVGPMRWMIAASAFLGVITVTIGVLAGPAIALAERASAQLLDSTAYRDAALDRNGAARRAATGDAKEDRP